MSKGRLTRVLAGALILSASAFGGLRGQSVPNEDVVILNDHLHVHEVFVIDARGERHVLGFVGHDQIKSFDVPAKYEAMGPYRIALQQFLPLPQLGVPADAYPYKVTPALSPLPGEMVSIVVGSDIALSSVEVVGARQLRQQMR
jgi:hypothetical protein